MDDLDRKNICLKVSVDIIKSLKLNPETKHLQTMTPEHTKAWIQGHEEVIRDLTEAVKVVRERYTNES